MEREKLLRVITELDREVLARGQALQYRVVSGSMRPLIAPGDEVTIRGEDGAKIERGDVVAWRSPRPGAYPVVHRVILQKLVRGSYRYRTKGDSNPRPDPAWVMPDQVLGKVVSIRKQGSGRTIRLDTAGGRLFSLAHGFVASLVSLARRQMQQVRDVCVPAPGRTALLNNTFFRYSAQSPIDSWLGATEYVERWAGLLLSSPEAKSLSFADVQLPKGFSEEALVLMRKGVSVEPLDPDGTAARPEAYDWVLASRCVDLLPGRDARLRLYAKVRASLREKGKILVTAIPRKEAGGLRRLLSPLFPRRFMRSVIDELVSSGFTIVGQYSDGRWFSVTAEKDVRPS